MEQKRKYTFQADADSIVYEEESAAFQRGSVTPPTNYQILLCDAISNITSQVGELMTRAGLKTVIDYQKESQQQSIDRRDKTGTPQV